MNTDDRLTRLEERVSNIEILSAKVDTKLEALLKSTDNLRKVVYGFAFILLLTVVYGAIGSGGFNQVVSAVKDPPAIITKTEVK